MCYKHNPGFLRFVERSGLPFRPYERFHRAELDERSDLYRRLAERVWDPDDLLSIVSQADSLHPNGAVRAC